jgi:hypothetical protein
MPKSKVRKKSDFTVSGVSRTPVKVKAGPSSVWFVALFVGLMLIGLIWLMVFQLAATGPDAPSLDGQPRPVELRRRVCFHDQRLVAHNAVAVAAVAAVMNSSWVCAVTGLATSDPTDHTRVIHPHCV